MTGAIRSSSAATARWTSVSWSGGSGASGTGGNSSAGLAPGRTRRGSASGGDADRSRVPRPPDRRRVLRAVLAAACPRRLAAAAGRSPRARPVRASPPAAAPAAARARGPPRRPRSSVTHRLDHALVRSRRRGRSGHRVGHQRRSTQTWTRRQRLRLHRRRHADHHDGRARRGAPRRPRRRRRRRHGSPTPGTYDNIDRTSRPGETAQFAITVPALDLPSSGEPGVYWFGVHALGDGRGRPRSGRRRPRPHVPPAGRRRHRRRRSTPPSCCRCASGRPARARRQPRRSRRAGQPAARTGRPAPAAGRLRRRRRDRAAHLAGRPRRARRRRLARARQPARSPSRPTAARTAGQSPRAPARRARSPARRRARRRAARPRTDATAAVDAGVPGCDRLARGAHGSTRCSALPYGDLDVAAAAAQRTPACYRRARARTGPPLRRLGACRSPARWRRPAAPSTRRPAPAPSRGRRRAGRRPVLAGSPPPVGAALGGGSLGAPRRSGRRQRRPRPRRAARRRWRCASASSPRPRCACSARTSKPLVVVAPADLGPRADWRTTASSRASTCRWLQPRPRSTAAGTWPAPRADADQLTYPAAPRPGASCRAPTSPPPGR